MKVKHLLFLALIMIGVILAGCGKEGENSSNQKPTNKKLTVYTTIYPLEDFTKKIGGEFVNVKSIYPPNVDAHSFEPTTKKMMQIASSDLFIYTGAGVEGFAEKATKTLKNENVKIIKAAEGISLLKSSEEHSHEEEGHHEEEADHKEEGHSEEEHDEHGDYDPHIWLDPIRSIQIASNIKDSLIQSQPENKDYFEQNFADLKSKLEELDAQFKDTVNKGKTKYIVVAHGAYGYWQDRYGIEQIAISGLSPTQEPSQKDLENIVEESKQHQIHYVIFEQNVSPKIAKLIQSEIGADSLTLRNLESITKEEEENHEDYFSLMNKNIEALKIALNK